jgi:hypothetical protein
MKLSQKLLPARWGSRVGPEYEIKILSLDLEFAVVHWGREWAGSEQANDWNWMFNQVFNSEHSSWYYDRALR